MVYRTIQGSGAAKSGSDGCRGMRRAASGGPARRIGAASTEHTPMAQQQLEERNHNSRKKESGRRKKRLTPWPHMGAARTETDDEDLLIGLTVHTGPDDDDGSPARAGIDPLPAHRSGRRR